MSVIEIPFYGLILIISCLLGVISFARDLLQAPSLSRCVYTRVSSLMRILYIASHYSVFLHLCSSKRRKLSQRRVDMWIGG